MAALVSFAALKVTKYSYGCPGIPMAVQVVPFSLLKIHVWGRRRYYFDKPLQPQDLKGWNVFVVAVKL